MMTMRRAALGAALALLLAPAPQAQEAAAGGLHVDAPWTRAAGANGTGVGYMAIRNGGAAADTLVAARSPAARAVELHSMQHEGGVMRMRAVPGVAIPAGQEVLLQPGGLHLMLMGLTAPLRQGESVPVTLVFERAGEVTVTLKVESAGARAPSGGATHRH